MDVITNLKGTEWTREGPLVLRKTGKQTLATEVHSHIPNAAEKGNRKERLKARRIG